jgi:cytochrome c oxidase subunit 4
MSKHPQEHTATADRDSEASEHVSSVGLYTTVYVVLMILLALTLGMDFLLTGTLKLLHVASAVALIIAFTKAMLVVLYFMHVRFASRVTWVFAASATLWLSIMLALMFSDYLTRSEQPPRTAQTLSYQQPFPQSQGPSRPVLRR